MGHNQNSAYQDQTWIIKHFIRVFTVCFNFSQNLNKNEEKITQELEIEIDTTKW